MNMVLETATGSSARLMQPPQAARRAVALCFFLNGALFASWVSRIPAVQAKLGLSHGALGVALFGVALGALLAMPLAGWLSARFGSRTVTRIAALAFCVSIPWLAVAPTVAWLMLGLLCFGAAHGAFDVAMNAQAVAVEERFNRPIMSSLHALWSIGGLAGAVTGGLLASMSVSLLAHFTSVAVVLGGIAIFLVLPRLLDAGEPLARALAEPVERRAGFAWPPRTLLALGAVAFCIMLGEGAIADWSAIFLRTATGSSEAVAAAGYAAFSIAMAAARFTGDPLSARFGPVALIRIGGGLAAAGLALALLHGHPVTALIGFAAVGAGFATIVPQVFSAAGRTAGMEPAPALAVATTLGYTGFLLGPPIIGFAAEFAGLRGALGIVVAMSLVAVTMASNVRRSGEIV